MAPCTSSISFPASSSISSPQQLFLASCAPMSTFGHSLLLSAPLFALVLIGYLLAAWPRWPAAWTRWISTLVLNVALPALLFHL
jgi:predicted permease